MVKRKGRLAGRGVEILFGQEGEEQLPQGSLPGKPPSLRSGVRRTRQKKPVGDAEAAKVARWTALLEEPRKGRIRLAVGFREPLPKQESLPPQQTLGGLSLPLVRADGVTYQSGLVAVEGDAELEVQVSTAARRVDVGELALAQREPGRGLLGVFGYVGDPPEVAIDVFRRPAHPLCPTIASSEYPASR